MSVACAVQEMNLIRTSAGEADQQLDLGQVAIDDINRAAGIAIDRVQSIQTANSEVERLASEMRGLPNAGAEATTPLDRACTQIGVTSNGFVRAVGNIGDRVLGARELFSNASYKLVVGHHAAEACKDEIAESIENVAVATDRGASPEMLRVYEEDKANLDKAAGVAGQIETLLGETRGLARCNLVTTSFNNYVSDSRTIALHNITNKISEGAREIRVLGTQVVKDDIRLGAEAVVALRNIGGETSHVTSGLLAKASGAVSALVESLKFEVAQPKANLAEVQTLLGALATHLSKVTNTL